MTDQSMAPGTVPESSSQSRFAPHRLALMIIWLLVTVTLVIMLAGNVRNSGQFRVERYILHAAYVAALLWYLGRTGPSVEQLPDIPPLLPPHWRMGQLLPVLVIVLLLLAVFSEGVGILMYFLMIATLWVLMVWRREIRLRSVVLGLALAVIALLGGLPFWDHRFVGKPLFIVLLAFVPPMFVAGGLLLQRTGLGGSRLHAGQYAEALSSFLWGGLLFVPFDYMINMIPWVMVYTGA